MKSKLVVIATYGQPRRRDRVRVVAATIRGESVVSVAWKEGDMRRSQSFPNTRKGTVEAKAFAESMSDRLAARQVQVEYVYMTVRQLFEKYINAKVDEWRPRSLQAKKERWEKFELFIGKKTPAHMVTRERLDEFKRVLLATGKAPNQVRHCIDTATAVFRWAVDRDLIPPTKVIGYRVKFGKDVQKKLKMAEYSPDERMKIVAEMKPNSANSWRAWVLTTLFMYCGPRENAALHLEWDDVTLDVPTVEDGVATFSGRVLWNPAYDKMGGERVQPLPSPVAEALWVAYAWRIQTGYQGRWVFFGAREKTKESDRPYTFQAYTYALHEAEKRAGVTSIKYRGAHAFRRGIAKDIYDLTQSEHKAAEWIGDKSVKVVKESYLLEREESQRELASLAGTKMQPTKTEDADG